MAVVQKLFSPDRFLHVTSALNALTALSRISHTPPQAVAPQVPELFLETWSKSDKPTAQAAYIHKINSQKLLLLNLLQ